MADNTDTTVLALACHPDDIEFMMGGTLFLLKAAGCTLHYMNLANGCCGSTQYSRDQTARIRREEGRRAAQLLGASFHESLADDLEVFYAPELIRKVTAVVRRIRPDIMLLPSPEDYMEDHMNTCRIGVTAAFSRCVPNYPTDPPVEATCQDVVLYHALPYGLRDALRRPIVPDFFMRARKRGSIRPRVWTVTCRPCGICPRRSRPQQGEKATPKGGAATPIWAFPPLKSIRFLRC
jgi:LmbE family N-acetylglucosaminyl deacetylase